jgi:hypothetical protein
VQSYVKECQFDFTQAVDVVLVSSPVPGVKRLRDGQLRQIGALGSGAADKFLNRALHDTDVLDEHAMLNFVVSHAVEQRQLITLAATSAHAAMGRPHSDRGSMAPPSNEG